MRFFTSLTVLCVLLTGCVSHKPKAPPVVLDEPVAVYPVELINVKYCGKTVYFVVSYSDGRTRPFDVSDYVDLGLGNPKEDAVIRTLDITENCPVIHTT